MLEFDLNFKCKMVSVLRFNIYAVKNNLKISIYVIFITFKRENKVTVKVYFNKPLPKNSVFILFYIL